MSYLIALNRSQQEAVQVVDGPVLILAGAGSGKTRVLVHRIAHLIFQGHADFSEIFAVTFTNKAAAELRDRVHDLLTRYMNDNDQSGPIESMWVSTFHRACVRILRSEIHHLDYNNHFTIYDDSEQLSLIKACMKDLNISDTAISPKAIQARINKIKNDGDNHLTYRNLYGGPIEDLIMQVFCRYSEALKSCSALDFADLILMTLTLFQKHPEVLLKYQKRFRYYLIDEYQDTNRAQYLLMKCLAGVSGNICAVGDEDQSIYRWRGADITNILNFERDYPNAKVFKLEENYRSTSNIIRAASHVISHNTERRDKELWTNNQEGEKITVFEAYDEHDEASKVTSEINQALIDGFSLNQIAIFYRTNAQSRLLEDLLRAKSINYQVYGGLKFYDRLEIKDVLAYLKLIANPKDDVSFRRIINVPGRGIGAVSLERFSQYASKLKLSHYELLEALFSEEGVSAGEVNLGRSKANFKRFFDMMQGLRNAKAGLLPSDLFNVVLEDSGYRKSLSDEQTVESLSRLENLQELRQSLVEYELRSRAEHPEKEISLENFLEEIALVSDSDRFDPDAPCLKMMTIHMAKGLEFDVVLLTGLEEELFPHIRPWAIGDPSSIEEERRLFYVGMTRARRRLEIFYAKNRNVFGTMRIRAVSRFIGEIPENFCILKKADYFSRRNNYIERPGVPRASSINSNDCSDLDSNSSKLDNSYDYSQEYYPDDEGNCFRKGNRVIHPTFGEGIVRQLIGRDKIAVEFPGVGLKKLSTKFALVKA